MAGLVIKQGALTPETAQALIQSCPFGALVMENGVLSVNAGCKMCKLCIKKSDGIIALQETKQPQVDKTAWRGVAVFADFAHGQLHPVSLELLGKARELASVSAQPVYALLIGEHTAAAAQTLLHYGADAVYGYDHSALADFRIEPYANAFAHFIETVHPSSILVGATNLGRSLAPRVAARFGTGLTADCTVLEMEENTDLVQIRPAFGGNIMARIITPNHRPQFCTVRYKIFSQPEWIAQPQGKLVPMALTPEMLRSDIAIETVQAKPREKDISDAEVIVALGRGLKKQEDLQLAQQLAEALGAQLACTRPLIEKGWFDAKKQIGLSGRTVKPKLIVALGISGAVQFTAGMRGAQCIVAVNSDAQAPIFDVAHYGIVGDLCTVLPALLTSIQGGDSGVS